jgi:hypothetical protein
MCVHPKRKNRRSVEKTEQQGGGEEPTVGTLGLTPKQPQRALRTNLTPARFPVPGYEAVEGYRCRHSWGDRTAQCQTDPNIR